MSTQSQTLWVPSGTMVRLPSATVPPSAACTSWLPSRLHALGAGTAAKPAATSGPDAITAIVAPTISNRRHHRAIRGRVVADTQRTLLGPRVSQTRLRRAIGGGADPHGGGSTATFLDE